MKPDTIRLFVPYSTEAPWVVRHEVARVGTYASHAEAVSAAVAMRLKLSRAWGQIHPPVRVQESDGSWRDVTEGGQDQAG